MICPAVVQRAIDQARPRRRASGPSLTSALAAVNVLGQASSFFIKALGPFFFGGVKKREVRFRLLAPGRQQDDGCCLKPNQSCRWASSAAVRGVVLSLKLSLSLGSNE